MSSMREWAVGSGVLEIYEMYLREIDDLCEYYGDHTDDLELAISQTQENYPELFGPDD